MAGYGGSGAPKAGKVDLSENAINGITDAMQTGLENMDKFQGKMVKLRNAEVELLKQFEAARDYMMEMLQNPDPGRETLQKIFGGDCVRIARIRLVLDTAKFSDMYENDNRIGDCKAACESVEKVLEDLGLGAALRKALEDQKSALQKRKSGIIPTEVIQAAAEPEVAVVEEPVIEEPVVVEEEKEPEPPAPEPEPPAPEPEPPAPEPPKEIIGESLIDRILACTSAAELAEIEGPDKEDLSNWMIWMVHRAHLDDPTLDKFDFTNLKMPPPAEEPRIAPKLAKAIGTNTHITQLELANTNLQSAQGGVMAESIAVNSSIKIFNIDSNMVGQVEMDSLANAFGTNQTLEQIRVNNQHSLMMGRSTFEAFSNAVKANKMICKLGLNISDPHFRGEIDRQIMRNNDDARKRRVEAKKAAAA